MCWLKLLCRCDSLVTAEAEKKAHFARVLTDDPQFFSVSLRCTLVGPARLGYNFMNYTYIFKL